MPLNLTKVAFGSESAASLRQWLESHEGEARLTTRYLPKRVDEMAGGSLYWIHGHQLVGRSPLLGFKETGQGRYWIRLEPKLILVQTLAKRAHQGWRYLEEKDAPSDLGSADLDISAMPARMLGELSRLGLL